VEKESASRVVEVHYLDLLEEMVRRERIDQEEAIVEAASDVEDDEWSTDGLDDEVVEAD
jgi:hypothetical protein